MGAISTRGRALGPWEITWWVQQANDALFSDSKADKVVVYRLDPRKGNAVGVGWSCQGSSSLVSVLALVTWIRVGGDQDLLPPVRPWKRPQLATCCLHLTCHMKELPLKEPPRRGGTPQPSSVNTVVATEKEITADSWCVGLAQMPLCDSPLWWCHTWCTPVQGREGKEGKGEGKHFACLSELYSEDRVVEPFPPSALSWLTAWGGSQNTWSPQHKAVGIW